MPEPNKPRNVVRQLTEDRPGEHWYVFTCAECHRDISEEWVERVWGRSESPASIQPHLCPHDECGSVRPYKGQHGSAFAAAKSQ
jgi:hypothetical protein